MANPKLSTLVDLFDQATLDTPVWNNSSPSPDVTLDTSLDRIQIACQAYYPILSAVGPFDAIGSSLFARVTPAPVGAGTTQTIMRIAVDTNNRVTYYTDGGGILTARITNAGINTDVVIGTYDPYSHAWWRLREAAGTIYFDTAPDGWTWTNRASIAYAWDASAVQAVFLCGYYGTEAAGMTAYVDHVNTTSSAIGQPNLNWPQVEDAWGPWWNANAGTTPMDRYVEVTHRTRGTASIQRGRQYELDQVRSGEANLTLANTDGALDPTNTAGPWYGHIQPYQPYRKRAQWPPTRNLLEQVMATGGDLGGFTAGTISGSATDIFSSSDSSGGSFVTSTSAWQGSTVMQFAVQSGAAVSTRIVYTPRWPVIPGQTYTVQLRARNVTAGTSLLVRPFIGSYNTLAGSTLFFGTSATLTGSASAAWTTLTATVAIPAVSGGMSCGLALGTSVAAAACSIQVDGWQLEKGPTATTWQCPGVWFPMFAGWTERWTPSWDMQGTYGKVAPTAVDTFSLLSQQQLSDPLTEEINSHSPRFVYKLDDPSGSTSVADWTGNQPAAQLAVSKYGAGSLTFGNAITATDATGLYTGSSGTVATLNNANPGTNLAPSAATFIKLTSAGIKGPSDPTVWTRAIAFRYTGPMPTAAACMWSAMDTQRASGQPSGSHIYVYLFTDGKPILHMQGPGGTSVNTYFSGATNCVDGDWHLLVFGYNQAINQLIVSQDGAVGVLGSLSTAVTPTGLAGDNLGAFVDVTVGNGTTWNWKGDLSFAVEFPAYLSSADITNLYTAWKSAASGESTDSRYARILRYAGYNGYNSIQTGLTTSMGPANIAGQDAMSALQAVVDTESGAHYIATDGTIAFRARSARYNATTPTYVFGENTVAGEWPYEDVQLDFDSTHLSNQVTVTQEGTSQNFYATDATSIANYFPRTMSRSINTSSSGECQDAASYLLSRYKQSAMRVSSIKLHPSANPALWTVCLNLELGTRARVMRRPPGLPAISIDCFIENIQWDLDDRGEAWCTLQCSPADTTVYGVFSAWHTTLNTSIAAGVTSIVVNASADTTNPLAAQLAPGEQLSLGQGTTNQETVTVAAVGATSAGWTTATITLTAATTKAHTAGGTVCDVLPTGVTDPAKYDAVSKFDTSAFAY